jgi:hypothetical protein
MHINDIALYMRLELYISSLAAKRRETWFERFAAALRPAPDLITI